MIGYHLALTYFPQNLTSLQLNSRQHLPHGKYDRRITVAYSFLSNLDVESLKEEIHLV